MAWAFKNTEVVRLGDDEYTLAIDLEIIDALEDEFNLNFDELLGLVGKGRIGKTARLVRGLLDRHHPALSLDDVAEIIEGHMVEFVTGMERLFTKARPEEKPEAKDQNPPTARRGTGASSLSNGARKGSRRVTSGDRPPALSS